MGRKHSPETRARISATMKARGVKPSARTAKLGGKARAAGAFGANHAQWNPNKSTDAIDRMLFKNYLAPLTKHRDNHTCALCQVRGGQLHSHHIKPFSVCPELRFSFVNTVTLCDRCHKALHGGYGINAVDGSRLLWKFLSSQLTDKKVSKLETSLIDALSNYRDVLAANQGDITTRWKELEAALNAYKEHFQYD